MEDVSAQADEPSKWHKTSVWVRIVIAIVLIGTYAYVFVWRFPECTIVKVSDVPADKLSTTTTCAPPEIGSGSIILLLLLLALLILPEVSEVTIGNVTLKRMVKGVKQQAEAAQESVQSLSATVQSLQMRMEIGVNNSTSIFLTPQYAKELREFSAGHSTGTASNQNTIADQLEDSVEWLTGRIVRDWERVKSRLNLDNRLQVQKDASTPEAEALTSIHR